MRILFGSQPGFEAVTLGEGGLHRHILDGRIDREVCRNIPVQTMDPTTSDWMQMQNMLDTVFKKSLLLLR